MKIILFIYLSVAFFVFFNFVIGKLYFTMVDKKTGEEVDITSIRYALFVALFSVAWPLVIIYKIKDEED